MILVLAVPGLGNGQTPVPGPGPKYRTPTPAEVAANRQVALSWAEQIRQGISPGVRLIETEHFLIFSTWPRASDGHLGQVSEQMYRELIVRLRLSPQETIWVGKCPIYVFWTKAEFARFTAEVDRNPRMGSKVDRVRGYHGRRGAFSYIALNGTSKPLPLTQDRLKPFHEVLVHEGTHAFLSRYLNSRPMARWVEEGFAEYMTSAVVADSDTLAEAMSATRRALRGEVPVLRLFERDELSPVDYGLAHSLIHFLIAADNQAFVRFLVLMKQGRSDRQALLEAYRTTPEALVSQWLLHSRRTLGGS